MDNNHAEQIDLWRERIDGYIADPDGKFSMVDLNDPQLMLSKVAEAYGLRRPRSDGQVGQAALAEVNAVQESAKWLR